MFIVQWQIRDSAKLFQVVHFNWFPMPTLNAVPPCCWLLLFYVLCEKRVCSCFLSRLPNWGGLKKMCKKKNNGALQITCQPMHTHIQLVKSSCCHHFKANVPWNRACNSITEHRIDSRWSGGININILIWLAAAAIYLFMHYWKALSIKRLMRWLTKAISLRRKPGISLQN